LSVEALTAAAELPNVYVDTAGLRAAGRMQEGGRDVLFAEDNDLVSRGPRDILHWLVDDMGLGDRLVFGSSYPFVASWQSSVVEDAVALREAELADDQLRAVLSGNALRMLGAD
jgi:predicted TIM-barrel fold metal-dependent hydrolase